MPDTIQIIPRIHPIRARTFSFFLKKKAQTNSPGVATRPNKGKNLSEKLSTGVHGCTVKTNQHHEIRVPDPRTKNKGRPKNLTYLAYLF
jgi:hypothetical protein